MRPNRSRRRYTWRRRVRKNLKEGSRSQTNLELHWTHSAKIGKAAMAR